MASKINADEFVDREGEGKPTLPKGVVLSGVTTITTAVVAGNEVANSTGINAGIITSTHFKGNLTGDVNAGIVTVTSQTVVGSAVTISASGIDIGAGVITATSYAGSGANLTGLGATIMIWEYTPDPYVDEVAVDAGIGITFNQKIKAGSGNVTLRIAGAAGTVVENFGVGSSVTIANNEISFTPTSDLDQNVTYFVDIPSSSLTNMAGDSYVGTGYTFQTTYILEQMWVLGKNQLGQLGQNQSESVLNGYSSPVQVPGATWKTFRRSSNGVEQAAIKTDGTLWTWGSNNYGQLGQNSIINLSSPTQVPGTWTPFNNSQNAFSGGGCNKIVKTDGTLWTWGNSFYGALGHNDNVKRSSPVQVGSDTTWSSVVGDRISTLALKTDGTLWSFGQNEYGELGINNKTDRSSPTQIPGTTWAILGRSDGTGTSNGAIKTDGTLWVWGRNEAGRLGLNNQTEYSSPKQIPGTTWANLVFSEQSMATKTDGTLWMWGTGGFGGTGQNNQTQYSSPRQVPGTTWDTENFKTSNYISMALKTDGTLWAWGLGGDGVLGQNSQTQYSSPVQVGSNTNWKQLGGSAAASLLGAHVPSST